MSAIGCRIRTDFPRPPRELVELFRGVPVANIDDCMNRMAAIDAAIRPLNAAPLLGTAFTVKVAEGDNLMFHKAMDMAQPSDSKNTADMTIPAPLTPAAPTASMSPSRTVCTRRSGVISTPKMSKAKTAITPKAAAMPFMFIVLPSGSENP